MLADLASTPHALHPVPAEVAHALTAHLPLTGVLPGLHLVHVVADEHATQSPATGSAYVVQSPHAAAATPYFPATQGTHFLVAVSNP